MIDGVNLNHHNDGTGKVSSRLQKIRPIISTWGGTWVSINIPNQQMARVTGNADGECVQTIHYVKSCIHLFEGYIIPNSSEKTPYLTVITILTNYVKIRKMKIDIRFKPSFA